MKTAISSGKGGTGKTTVSVNLAAYIAETEQVVLTDLDVEEPNSGLFLNSKQVSEEIKYTAIPVHVKHKCDENGNCSKVCAYGAIIRIGPELMIIDDLCHSCYACAELCPNGALTMTDRRIGKLIRSEAGNLSFIESRLDVGIEQAVPLIVQTLKYVDEHIQDDVLKIYDTPPGTSCPVIESVKHADLVLLVTEPTPFGLHDLKLSVKAMKELKKKIAVVINRYGVGNDETEKYCAEENIEIIAKIPDSRTIAEIYSRGSLIYDKVPEFKEQLEKIRTYIAGTGK